MSGAITARSTKKEKRSIAAASEPVPRESLIFLRRGYLGKQAALPAKACATHWESLPVGPGMKGSHVSAELGNIVPSVFTPVLAKHSKSSSLIDCISVGVDRMQRSFEPMRKQVEAWQRSDLTDVTAKVVIYEAFVEGELEAPKHLARTVHDLYFEPRYEEFRPRTIWSLSNAFTLAFKELDPIPRFKATAKWGEFLEAQFSQSF